MGKILYYTSKTGDCEPCKEINQLVESGKFVSPDGEVDLVDISTDEGFKRFNEQVLSKQDGAVPSAYKDGKKCQILLEDGKVFFECPSDEKPDETSTDVPSIPEPKSSLP